MKLKIFFIFFIFFKYLYSWKSDLNEWIKTKYSVNPIIIGNK